MPENSSQETSTESPIAFVLFGAAGDLAKRMVLPAFYELATHGLLPTRWALIGAGRRSWSDDEFRAHVRDSLNEFGSAPDDSDWEEFAGNLRFAGGGFTVDDPGAVLDVLGDYPKDTWQLVHYLAVPPTAFGPLTEAFGAHDLAAGSRVVYEKPFGTSRDSFHKLDKQVHDVFDEKQVFRIDHFLGKENTQNLHVLRFANGLFTGVWNNRHVEQVQIDVPETLNIDDRAKFYDSTGAVLDMVVTHLFQVAAEVAMEPPLSLSADDLQTARESVIAAFRPLDPSEAVFGQYEGYRDVDGVVPDSTTETFIALRMWVDTDRWHGVPFLLRTGKCLGRSAQRVNLVFRNPEDGPITHIPADGNVLSFDLSGEGAIDLRMTIKKPGPGLSLSTAHMELPLKEVADGLSPYSRLLSDVLRGDRSLFTRPDGLQHVWDVATPLIDNEGTPLPYPQGSMGPSEADALAGPAGWVEPAPQHD